MAWGKAIFVVFLERQTLPKFQDYAKTLASEELEARS